MFCGSTDRKMLPKNTMILGLLSCSSRARRKPCQPVMCAVRSDRDLRQRIPRMAPDHDREIEQKERAADAEGDVEPFELGEQRLQAVERRRRPGERPHHHGEGREQSAAPAGDGRGLDHQHRRRSGARHRQQMDDGEAQQGDDVVHERPPLRASTDALSHDIRAPRRRATWRRCRCGRARPGRGLPSGRRRSAPCRTCR